MADINVGAIAATTFKNSAKEIADNVTNHIPTLKYFDMKGSVVLDGGEKISEPLMYAETSGGSYGKGDKFTISKTDGIDEATYNWKQLYANVTIYGIERLKNSGKERIHNLLETEKKRAEITLRNKFAKMLFGDGTGNSGKDTLGLEAFCDQDPTTGVLGQIDRSTETWWRNQVNTSVGSFASNGVAACSTMIRDCTRGMDRPNVIVTGSTIFGYMQNTAFSKAFLSNPKLASLNFQSLQFEGIDVIFDSECPDDRIYFLNLDYLKVKIHKDENYKPGPMIRPADENVEVMQILLSTQLCSSNCSLQGVLSGITA